MITKYSKIPLVDTRGTAVLRSTSDGNNSIFAHGVKHIEIIPNARANLCIPKVRIYLPQRSTKRLVVSGQIYRGRFVASVPPTEELNRETKRNRRGYVCRRSPVCIMYHAIRNRNDFRD